MNLRVSQTEAVYCVSHLEFVETMFVLAPVVQVRAFVFPGQCMGNSVLWLRSLGILFVPGS